jgi:hypothetical protein
MDNINIVDAVVAHDKEAFMAAFNSAIANKVSDALEIKKVEIASTMLVPDVPDVTETEVETSNEIE